MRASLLSLALLAGCASAVPAPTERDAATARRTDPAATVASLAHGRERYIARCSGCHALHGAYERRADEWPAMVSKMAKRAKCTDDERRAIELYLTSVSEGGVK